MVHSQNHSLGLKLGGAALIALFLLTTWFAQPAASVTPPLQDGRPTLPPPPPPVGPGGAGLEGVGGVTGESCTSLRGTVINWGFQNEPGVTLRLSDGGWETTQVTSTDGHYQFGPLGQGVALLSIQLSPEQAETLRPMADEVAIRLRCDFDLIANLGLYSSSSRPDPPATLTMGVSQTAILPGGNVIFYLTLNNAMPHPISHVFVTDFVPDGLIVTDATTTRGSVEVLSGRMVTVAMGDVPQGGKETIQITAQAASNLAYGTRLQNTASLLYAESAADQAWATLTIGGAQGVAVATPTPLPAESPIQSTPSTPAATAEMLEATTTQLPSTPAAEQTPGAGDELLPVTGGAGGVALPAVGIGLALALVGVRRLRGWLATR